MPHPTTLQHELVELQACIDAATGHPFIPAQARDAIAQAGRVLGLLATEVAALRALITTAERAA